jgi:Transglycosylase-like domain
LIKYLIALVFAFSIVLSLPADANVQNSTPKVVHEVAPIKAKDVTPEPVIPPAVMHQWALVAQCETGSNWHMKGWQYSGGLGILEANWHYFGGEALFGPEWLATPAEQVFIAIKIQHGLPVPDQHGCEGGW